MRFGMLGISVLPLVLGCTPGGEDSKPTDSGAEETGDPTDSETGDSPTDSGTDSADDSGGDSAETGDTGAPADSGTDTGGTGETSVGGPGESYEFWVATFAELEDTTTGDKQSEELPVYLENTDECVATEGMLMGIAETTVVFGAYTRGRCLGSDGYVEAGINLYESYLMSVVSLDASSLHAEVREDDVVATYTCELASDVATCVLEGPGLRVTVNFERDVENASVDGTAIGDWVVTEWEEGGEVTAFPVTEEMEYQGAYGQISEGLRIHVDEDGGGYFGEYASEFYTTPDYYSALYELSGVGALLSDPYASGFDLSLAMPDSDSVSLACVAEGGATSLSCTGEGVTFTAMKVDYSGSPWGRF